MRSSVPYRLGASVGLSGGGDQHGHDDDPDRDAQDDTEHEADHELQHCAASLDTFSFGGCPVSRFSAEYRSQPLDVGLGHVGELQTHVKPGRSLGLELDQPDDLGPTANRRAVGEEDVEVELTCDLEAFVREDTHAAKTDVSRVPLVMCEPKAGRPAEDLCVDARVATPIGHGDRLFDVRTRATPSQRSSSLGLVSACRRLRLCARQAPGSPGDVHLGIIDRLTGFELRQDRAACFLGNVLSVGGGLQYGHCDPPSRWGAIRKQAVAIDSLAAVFQAVACLFDDHRILSRFDPKRLRVWVQYAISMVRTMEMQARRKLLSVTNITLVRAILNSCFEPGWATCSPVPT